MAKEKKEKKENLRDLTPKEWSSLLLEKSEDLFRYRMRFTTGQLEQNHLIRKTRRDIARLKTLLRENENKPDGTAAE